MCVLLAIGIRYCHVGKSTQNLIIYCYVRSQQRGTRYMSRSIRYTERGREQKDEKGNIVVAVLSSKPLTYTPTPH